MNRTPIDGRGQRGQLDQCGLILVRGQQVDTTVGDQDADGAVSRQIINNSGR